MPSCVRLCRLVRVLFVFILALKGDADMKSLPKLQKILLWAGVVLVVAALIAAPKYWDYCEMQALKAEFDRFVDVENWPESTYVKLNGHKIEEDDFIRVKAAVANLQFDGKADWDRWMDIHFVGTGMIDGSGTFSVWASQDITFPGYHIEVSIDGTYVYDTHWEFSASNGQELARLLEELQVKYPG